MRICLQRAIILAEEAQIYKEVIWLLDTDLLVLKRPAPLLEGWDADICIPDLHITATSGCPIARRYSAGFVGFAPTEQGRACLEFWADECKKDERPKEGLREQFYLYRAIEKIHPRIERLDPREYNWIPEGSDESKCVVMHTRDPERVRRHS
jgi:hypothetical protein